MDALNTGRSGDLNFATLSKVQKIRVILRRSENTFHLLQWLSMGKQFLKFKKINKTFVPKIILHYYILYKGDPTYVTIFPVESGDASDIYRFPAQHTGKIAM